MQGDTIAAVSTPPGEGGIGIIRISGPDAVKIAGAIFKARRADWQASASHSLFYGHILDRHGEVVDEVLLGCMKAPHTYTREDVVEINCHGGTVPLRRVLEQVLEHGARLAGPGEFSKRAFLNGRLDLAQAESIIDLIRAKTEAGLKLAVSQLRGDLSAGVLKLQDRLLGLLAQVEANIDFPEEGLEEATASGITTASRELLTELKMLIEGAEKGKIYREGLSTIIVGRTNVGKSSLLNALLRENRAIVTEIPGTTRDIIEEIINMRGIPLKIVDTAGLRETEDLVEKIGVARTREYIGKADLALFVLDGTRGLHPEDLTIETLLEEKKTIFLVNKVDLSEHVRLTPEDVGKLAGERPVLWISATEGTGLAELEETIFNMVTGGRVNTSDNLMVSSVRHKDSLERASGHLAEAIEGIDAGVPVDIVAIDIRAAWEALGEITGSTVTEDLLDRIFADFCIGK